MKDLDFFLGQFFPDSDEPIHLQVLPPKDARGFPQDFVITRNTLDARMDELRELNQSMNVYFRPNSGGSLDTSITRFNALFIEKDSGSFTKQHKALAPYRPHVLVETLKSVHAYWLLSPNELNAGAWRFLQNELIARFHSDKSIVNPSRLMRMPYFDYLIYSPMHGGTYRHLPLTNVAYDDHFDRIDGMVGYEKIFGARAMDINKAMIAGITEEFDPTADVLDGDGRNPALLRFTRSMCVRCSDPDVIRQAAIEYNQERIKPPLDDDKRDRVIDNAIRYGLKQY